MHDPALIEAHRLEKLETLLLGNVDSVTRDFESILKSLAPQLDSSAVCTALAFAKSKDYGQEELARFYVTHPIRVAIFALDWMRCHQNFSTDFAVAALVHNVFEKGVLEEQDCRRQFGDWVCHVVKTLTPNREALKTPAGKEAYYREIYSLPPSGQLLKFFDKFDNIYSLCLSPDENLRHEYLEEIRRFVRPIGEKFSPEWMPYFDQLVEATAHLGHLKPSFN